VNRQRQRDKSDLDLQLRKLNEKFDVDQSHLTQSLTQLDQLAFIIGMLIENVNMQLCEVESDLADRNKMALLATKQSLTK